MSVAAEEEEQVVLLDAQQRQLAADGSDSCGGEDVAWIELRHRAKGTARWTTLCLLLLCRETQVP